MRQGTGAELLGPNDPRSNDIAIIYVAPADVRQDVLAAILTQDKLGKKQIVIMLPEQNRAFRQSVDFDGLKNMRRGLKAKIVFVAPPGPGPANFARQRNFEVYSSLESYADSLRAQGVSDEPQRQARPRQEESRRQGFFKRHPRPMRTTPAVVPLPFAEPAATEPSRGSSAAGSGATGLPYRPIEDADTVEFDIPEAGAGEADSEAEGHTGLAGGAALAAGAGLGALAEKESAGHSGESAGDLSPQQNSSGTVGAADGSPGTADPGAVAAGSSSPAITPESSAGPSGGNTAALDPSPADADVSSGGASPVPGIISFPSSGSSRSRTTGKIAAASTVPTSPPPAAPEVISGQSVRPNIPNRRRRGADSGKMAAAGVAAGAVAGVAAADLASAPAGGTQAASSSVTPTSSAASGGPAGTWAAGSATSAGAPGVMAPPPAPPVRPGGPGGSGGRRTPPPRRNRRGFWIIALVLLLVLLGAFVAFANPGGMNRLTGGLVGGQPNAKITITPKSSDLKNSYDLRAITGRPNSGNREVQAQIITASASSTGQGNATGSIAATRATGFLRFLNIGTTGQTISGGTLTGASGVKVSFGGPIFVPVTGSASITITGTAVNAGAAGNIGAFDINGPCCASSIRVSDPNGFGGGHDAKPNSVIQQSDIDGAAQLVINSLKQSVQSKLQGQVTRNEQAVPSTFNCTQTVNHDHNAGDQAPVVHVNVTVSCREEVYDRDGALAMGTSLLTQKAGADLGPQYALVGHLAVSVQQATQVGANGELSLIVPAEGIWVYQFPANAQNELKTVVKGLAKAQAEEKLLAQPGVGQEQIDLGVGGDGKTLPTDVNQITISIKNIAGLPGGSPTPGGGGTPPSGNPTPSPTPQNGLGGS